MKKVKAAADRCEIHIQVCVKKRDEGMNVKIHKLKYKKKMELKKNKNQNQNS